LEIILPGSAISPVMRHPDLAAPLWSGNP
jgi:hypothetical protein